MAGDGKVSNSLLNITTPKGRVYQYKDKAGEVKVQIEWNKGFGDDWTDHLNTVQAQFDMEVLRLTDPYVPMQTGMLRRSAQLASNIGSGELVWNTPYAAEQYYHTSKSRGYSPTAGAYWGDRMKADNLTHLANFARKAVGNK